MTPIQLVGDEEAYRRIWLFSAIMSVSWAVRLARSLVGTAMKRERLAESPPEWRGDSVVKYEHYLRMADHFV